MVTYRLVGISVQYSRDQAFQHVQVGSRCIVEHAKEVLDTNISAQAVAVSRAFLARVSGGTETRTAFNVHWDMLLLQ
jgi:hypothetical protein